MDLSVAYYYYTFGLLLIIATQIECTSSNNLPSDKQNFKDNIVLRDSSSTSSSSSSNINSENRISNIMNSNSNINSAAKNVGGGGNRYSNYNPNNNHNNNKNNHKSDNIMFVNNNNNDPLQRKEITKYPESMNSFKGDYRRNSDRRSVSGGSIGSTTSGISISSSGDSSSLVNSNSDDNISGGTLEEVVTVTDENFAFVNNPVSGSSSSSSSSSGSSFNEENDDNNEEESSLSSLSLADQVRLLSKQLNALMMRRREDYKLLENNLKKSIHESFYVNGHHHKNTGVFKDRDIRMELEQLRQDMRVMRENCGCAGGNGANKEKLTLEWLTQSIGEMRKELTELQQTASNTSKDLSRRSLTFEDLATIKEDFKLYKLELEAIKERQESADVFLRELREEAVQHEEDLRKILRRHENEKSTIHNNVNNGDSQSSSIEYVLPEADHRMRHQRFLRDQVHELEISQRNLKRKLNELEYHHITDRVRNMEIEQRRLANANFNLSRQIANLDKLHSSMLELLEDVENIQNKIDKTIPDVKREISKLEFTSAQLNSEQSLIREEGHNAAKSIQAMAVSVSTLQDERDNVKKMQNKMIKLQENVERLQSMMAVKDSPQKSPLSSVWHQMVEAKSEEEDELIIVNNATNNNEEDNNSSYGKIDNSDIVNDDNSRNSNNKGNELHSMNSVENIVHQFESVEREYDSIINKLPSDCSQIDRTSAGLYLIAPAGQHRPTMAYCNDGWTMIQRRFDGSVDFNRSWEMYSQGFGIPSGEFWMGNENLHHLTLNNCTKLKIIMQDIYDQTWLAVYDYFYVSSRDDGYRLHVSGFSGNASDALDYQNLMQFSAIDVDRDISNTHCAANYEGGWWFSHCQHANLNGRYNLGLTWFDAIQNEWIAVKSSQMMLTVNPKGYCSSENNTSKNVDNNNSNFNNGINNNNNNNKASNNEYSNNNSISKSKKNLSFPTPSSYSSSSNKSLLTTSSSTSTTISSVV